jgi:hypothetical protein
VLLIIAAIVLVLAVVVMFALLLFVDLSGTSTSEWIPKLKEWQSLIGAVLGFLGAAGVLALTYAIDSEQQRQQAERAAYSIGLGLALEVERLAVGLQVGRDIGAFIDFSEDKAGELPQLCLSYSLAVQRALAPDTPVYNAVLPRMIDFGEANLGVFVRFFSFYADFTRAIKEVDQAACNDAAEDEIRYIISQINGGLGFYEIIAGRYDTAPLQAPAVPPADETKT